jgi:hypothetical protein
MAKDGNTTLIDMNQLLPGLLNGAQPLLIQARSESFSVQATDDSAAVTRELWNGAKSGAEWTVTNTDGCEIARLLPLLTTQGLSVTLLDPQLNGLGSVFARTTDNNTTERGRRTSRDLAIVRDGDGRSSHVVRSDGPTGLHVVDASGAVVVLGSRAEEGDGLDVLVLPQVAVGPQRVATTTVFGVITSLCVAELLRVGALLTV